MSQRGWLSVSILIAVLGILSSAVGLLSDVIYTRETENWAAQAIGQDFVNALVAYPTLLITAFLAQRGSLHARLIWLGVLAYSVYTYAIYCFSVSFGPLFLLYVAIFGLSVYALVGALARTDPELVKSHFRPASPRSSTSLVLIGIASAFYVLWLSEVIPAMIANQPPDSLVEAGLATNPVHVLDMAIFLPALLFAGISLRRQRSWGYVLAPVLLVTLVLLSLGIILTIPVLDARGQPAPWGVAAAIGVIVVIVSVVLVRFLQALRPSAGQETEAD